MKMRNAFYFKGGQRGINQGSTHPFQLLKTQNVHVKWTGTKLNKYNSNVAW